MRHGIFLPPFGALAPPSAVVELAQAAEERGWDGLFLWDHVMRPAGDPQEISDPWIILAAVAARTSRIRLGPMITPLARRRPQKVARETVTLDRLSEGRLVLGVGLGVNTGGELERFGEDVDERSRAARLDEAIALLLGLWTGAEIHHAGAHFEASGVRFLPVPVQRPRIPVWVGAKGTPERIAPLRRAAALDGLFPVDTTPERLAAMVETVGELRGTLEGFDIAATIRPDCASTDLPAIESAGATWAMWSFGVHSSRDEVRRVIEQGPSA